MTTVKLHNDHNLPVVISTARQIMAHYMAKEHWRPDLSHITAYEVIEHNGSEPELFAIRLFKHDGDRVKELDFVKLAPYNKVSDYQFAEFMHAYSLMPEPGAKGTYELADYDDFFDRSECPST